MEHCVNYFKDSQNFFKGQIASGRDSSLPILVLSATSKGASPAIAESGKEEYHSLNAKNSQRTN